LVIKIILEDRQLSRIILMPGKKNYLDPIEFAAETAPMSRRFDTFDGTKPLFLNQGKKRRSVSTLSIPRASDRGVEWVD
jgi:hypothetical protein